jgi:DNA-binding beta-propeller fold protein YncE
MPAAMGIWGSSPACESTSLRFQISFSVMSLGLSLLAGCGQSISTSIGTAPHASGRQGSVYGGQQPIVGSSIQLYAVGTAGDGSAATPLFATPVTSDGSGSFTFGAYTCPSANTLVYLVATGGNPGLPGSANNTALALMAALGPCGNLNASTFINVNEVTTVSSVFPLAPYMASLDHIGSGASDAAALSSAFGVVNELANFRTGTVPGPALMAGYGVSTSQINTLADIMASCINSAGGVSGDGSACGSLFQYTGGNATTNTIAAAIQIAKNPTANTTQLFDLVQAQGPFQPTLSAAPSAFIASVLPQAPLPQFTPGTGAAFPITVSITASVGGSRVYYTTDGSTPTPGSTLYTVPFTIVGPTTVKAIAVVPGYANSPVSSIGYGVPVPGFTVKVVDVCSPRTGDSCAPQGLAVNPTTNTVYISGLSRGGNPINPPSDPTIPNLTILDGNTDTVSSFIATDLDSPYAVAVNPVTNKIYIGNAGAGDFLVMDGYTNTFTSLSLGYQGVAAGSLVLNPSTNTIYVNSAGTLYVVDGASSTLTTTIPVGTPLNSSMAINQVTDNLFVGGSAKANFLSINAATNSIVDAFTVAVQRTPYPVALNSVTNKVYLGAASLIVYDPVTLGTTLISSVSNCDALVVNPITNTIYALNSTGVSIIDGATNTVISTLPIADFTIRYDIGQLVIDPSLNKLYVISTYGVGSFTNNTASIAVLDLSTNTPSIIVGQQGTSGIGNAVLNPTTHKLYLEEEPNSIVIVSPT